MSARGRRCGRSRAGGRRAVRTNAGRNPAPPARASRPHPNWAGARRVPRVSPARPGRPVRVARGVRVRTFVPFGMRLSIVVVICARGERVRGQDSVAGASTTRGRRPAREGACCLSARQRASDVRGAGGAPGHRRAARTWIGCSYFTSVVMGGIGMVATREATLRERPPSRRGRGSGARAASRDSRLGSTPPRSRAGCVSRRGGGNQARSVADCLPSAPRGRFHARRHRSPRASLLLAARPLLRAVTRVRAPGRRTRRARPARARHARRFRSGRTTRSRSPDPRVRIRGVGPPRGHRRASPRERLPSPCRTLGSITRTPSWTVRCALGPTPRLARASPREPPPLGSRPTSRPPPRPRPNRHFDPVLLSRFVRSPHFAPPPTPSSSPQVEQLLRGVIISEEEVRVICEKVKEILAKEENVVPVAAPVTVVRKPVPRTKQNERPSLSHVSRSTGWRRSPARGSRDRSSAASRRARARAPPPGLPRRPPPPVPARFGGRASRPPPHPSRPHAPSGAYPPPDRATCARVASAPDRSCR